MRPEDLEFTLTAEEAKNISVTKYIVSGEYYWLIKLYCDLIDLSAKCPPTQNGVWLGELLTMHTETLDEAREMVSHYEHELWHFVLPKQIRWHTMAADSKGQQEIVLEVGVAGFGHPSAALLRDILETYYPSLDEAHKNVITVNGVTTVSTWDPTGKYFTEE